MSILDEDVEQPERFCEKKSTTSFDDGRKDHLDNAIIAIANFECLAQFTLESTGYPLAVKFLTELVDIISKQDFRQ